MSQYFLPPAQARTLLVCRVFEMNEVQAFKVFKKVRWGEGKEVTCPMCGMVTDSITVHARSVKPAIELDKGRTLEKQEIERRYWHSRGVDWGLVTDLDLPVQRVKNLRWLHEMQSLQHMTAPHPDYWDDRCGRFLACLPQATGMSTKQFVRLLESTQGFDIGEALTVIRHLAANKRIAIDLDAKFDMQVQVDTFAVAVPNAMAQPTRNIA